MMNIFGSMDGFEKLKANTFRKMCFVKFSSHEKAEEARDKAKDMGRRVEFARRELDDDGDEEGGMCTLACSLQEDKGDKGRGRGKGGSSGGGSGRPSGTFVRSKDTFGFIKMDDGQEIFVLPGDCVGYDSVLPLLGCRVSLTIGTDQKTGKPKAEDVYPEGKGPPGGSKSSKGSGKDFRQERRRDRDKQDAGGDDSNPNNIPVGNRDSSRQDDDEESKRPWKKPR